VPASGIIIDVGAHSGLATLYFSRFVDQPYILAFEPAPELYRCLRENVDRHVRNAETYSYALGKTNADLPFTYYPNAPSQSGIYADARRDDEATIAYLANIGIVGENADFLLSGMHTPELQQVHVSTLSTVIAREGLGRVDLLKIDAERAELDVLLGLDDHDWPRIRSVVMEVHDENGQLGQCAAVLRTRGFTVTVEQAPWLANSALFNVAAIR
jgi:FkbM family methyltransferase